MKAECQCKSPWLLNEDNECADIITASCADYGYLCEILGMGDCNDKIQPNGEIMVSFWGI